MRKHQAVFNTSLENIDVSQEGLIDAVFKGLAWVSKKFTKKTVNDRVDQYKNKTQMSTLTYRNGRIDSRNVFEYLCEYSGKKIPDDPADALRKHLEHCLTECKRIKKDIERDPKKVAAFRFDEKLLLGGGDFDNPTDGGSVEYGPNNGVYTRKGENSSIPALTATQATDLAAVIAEYLPKFWTFYSSCFEEGGDHDSFSFPVDESPNRDRWFDFFHGDSIVDLFYTPIEAADRWIQRSIK